MIPCSPTAQPQEGQAQIRVKRRGRTTAPAVTFSALRRVAESRRTIQLAEPAASMIPKRSASDAETMSPVLWAAAFSANGTPSKNAARPAIQRLFFDFMPNSFRDSAVTRCSLAWTCSTPWARNEPACISMKLHWDTRFLAPKDSQSQQPCPASAGHLLLTRLTRSFLVTSATGRGRGGQEFGQSDFMVWDGLRAGATR